MPYRLTLLQDLPANPPSALDVRYTYNNGHHPSTWQVTAVGPDTDTAVVRVNCAVDLRNVPNVKTRTLIAHYPTQPHTREFPISSVQATFAGAEVAGPEATEYSVDISMDENTLDALSDGNFVLYGFKAVKTSGVGAPLVWFQTMQFALDTHVAWTEQYQAYTSLSQIIPNGKIVATNSYDIDLDQTLNVTSPKGSGSIDTLHGTPLAISIYNETDTQFTCGISQSNPEGGVTPMCAFPLYGGNLDVIAPIEQILLMFSSMPVNTGTVIEQAYSRGIIIDLTGDNARTVSYDINEGWSWDSAPWASQVKANQDLVPLLIQSSPSLAKRQLASIGSH
ncbi:MAG TPA: hypothetical protein VGO81_16525 [Solirubrobacteraceae bacterium]|nr:hypothetical protein [Solirubrobacteraceae bacterium]